jgi:hypothetical protein
MRVQNLCWLGKELLPELKDTVRLARVVRRQGEEAQTLLASSGLKRASFRADHKLPVASRLEPARQKQ